jgi:hypothetical protein
MKTAFRWVFGVSFAFALVTLISVFALLWLLFAAAPDSVSIVIDGQRHTLPDWRQLHGGDWALAGGGTLLLALVLMVVLPVGLLLALLFSGLGVVVGLGSMLLVTVLVLLVALSPLWLIGLLLWWLLRPKRAATIDT